jgi:phosphoribosylformylglycinamidine synthase
VTHFVEVRTAPRFSDPRGGRLRARCVELGLAPERVETSRLYRLEGALGIGQVEKLARKLLADPVTETYRVRRGSPPPAAADCVSIDVWYRPEVSDPAAESVEKAAAELGIAALTRARCGQRAALSGPKIGKKEAGRLAEKVLANPVVHEWQIR